MAAALLAIGVVSEFAGIVLLGFPDFVPGAIRLSGWLGRHGRRGANRLRRLVGRSPRGVVHTAESGGVIVTGMSVTGVVSTSATTLEGKVDYLMRRDQDAQHMFDALAERVTRLEADSPRQLDEIRRQMEGHVARELMAALEAYRPLRVVGTILLAVGLGSVTASALLA